MSVKQLSIADFRTFRRRLTLVGTLRLETPLRIGTGQADELNGADIAVMKDAQRRPFIPGSSFKGALRSHTERLLRALCPNTDMRESACDPLTDSGRCIPGGRVLGVPDTILTIQNLRER